MANEDQPHNDHRLHIEACPCGDPAPEVGGDDFAADVMCQTCHRIEDGFGTKRAIANWNKKVLAHKNGEAQFPRPIPYFLDELPNICEKLKEQSLNAKEWKLEELAADLTQAKDLIEAAIKKETARREALP